MREKIAEIRAKVAEQNDLLTKLERHAAILEAGVDPTNIKSFKRGPPGFAKSRTTLVMQDGSEIVIRLTPPLLEVFSKR